MSLLFNDDPKSDEARRAAWLELRRKKVTSTDVPILFGQGYYGSSPTKLWALKQGRAPEDEPTERMILGKLMEQVIAEAYRLKTGRKVVRAASYLLQVSEKYPWLAASLDSSDESGAIVEMKNHGDYAKDILDLPTGWLFQCQTQLIVTGAPAIRLAVLCRGSQLEVFDIEPNVEVQQAIIDKSHIFYEHMMGTAPPPPEFAEDNAGLSLCFDPNPELVIQGSDELYARAQERAALLKQKQEVVDSLDIVEGAIKFELKETVVALFDDGSKLTWRPDKNGRRSLRYYQGK